MSFVKFEELLFTDAYLKCERCGAITRWKKPRQRKHGFCAEHSISLIGYPEDRRTLALMQKAFAGARIAVERSEPISAGSYPDRDVVIVARGRWVVGGFPHTIRVMSVPLDAGPCARCGGSIRRFGRYGRPLCKECGERR